jgi:MFS family permease
MRSSSGRGSIHYAWVITASSFLILFGGYGVHYSFGVFLPNIEESIAEGQRGALSLGFALYVVLYSIFSLFTGRLTDTLGPRPVVIIGGLLMGGGILLVGLSTTLWQYYLFYSVLVAAGMSSVLVPSTSTVVKWFVQKRGLAVGIVTTGIALGQFVMPPLSSLLIVNIGWRETYVAYGLGLALLLVVAGLLMRRDPESHGMLPYGANGGLIEETAEEPLTQEAASMRPMEALRTPAFWIFTGALFLFWVVVFLPPVHLPSFAEEALDASPGRAALTVTAVAVGAGVARFGVGYLTDAVGGMVAFLLVLVLQLLGFVGLFVAALMPSWALLYISAVGVGVGLGGSLVLFPIFTVNLFGRLYASSISGLVFAIAGAAAGIGVYLAGLIHDVTGSYTGAFALGIGTTLASLPLILLLKSPAPQSSEESPLDALPEQGKI